MRRAGIARVAYRWMAQVWDPIRTLRGLTGLWWLCRDLIAYRRAPGAESLRVSDSIPALHDRGAGHEIDAHYFYVNAWAMRRIIALGPQRHTDIASQTVLASLLSALLPVTYLDYRPLAARLDGLTCGTGNLLALDLASDSVESMSCLHVIEHIGLGRYGDPIDPAGSSRAANELARVLAPGGSLFLAVPIGRERVCFNAHRVHRAATIRQYLANLELVEFSGVHDDGRFVQHVGLDEFDGSDYGCGMFWFRKPLELPVGPLGSL